MNASISAGRVLPVDGYFTHARHLRAQGSEELERRLGYRKGRLANGWWLLFLQQMPTPDQFEVRIAAPAQGAGSRGADAGDTPAESPPLRLGDKIFSVKSRTLKDTFYLNGPGRLAKLLPVTNPFGEPEQAPAGGIPLFELTAPLAFRVVCLVAPGASYTGDYV